MEGFINEDDDESRYEQKRRWNIYTNYDDAYEINHDDNEREELCEVHEPPVCNVRRYMMIKYSFNNDEEYVAIKENKYDDLTINKGRGMRAYQEIFRIIDEGWMKVNLDNSTNNVLIPLDGWTSGLLVYKSPLSDALIVTELMCLGRFKEFSLTRVSTQSIGSSNTDVLDSPCLLVLITETSQSRQHGFPSVTVNTKEYHSECSGKISRIMQGSLCYQMLFKGEQQV
ncbi:hypothetical protein Tco_0841258 [Tanacetum coccineum]|uniref:Uncharacterized protein n=1 Tax=Tanacetum coccineum TaxID=301880 RepID=A0ABQ5B069_9ASTR